MISTSAQQTQATNKIQMQKQTRQTNKSFFYNISIFITGKIPFCMCLHAVRTFYMLVIIDS